MFFLTRTPALFAQSTVVDVGYFSGKLLLVYIEVLLLSLRSFQVSTRLLALQLRAIFIPETIAEQKKQIKTNQKQIKEMASDEPPAHESVEEDNEFVKAFKQRMEKIQEKLDEVTVAAIERQVNSDEKKEREISKRQIHLNKRAYGFGNKFVLGKWKSTFKVHSLAFVMKENIQNSDKSMYEQCSSITLFSYASPYRFGCFMCVFFAVLRV